ncbi:thioredoxin family protein, partial [Paraglaciecola sp.]
MLSNDILNALKSYTQNMTNKVSLVLQTGEQEKRSELKAFLTQLCSVSDNLSLVERDENLRSPITFYLEVEGKNNGIHFSGIPSGHEFNSLILAILQSSGTELKLDKTLRGMIEKIQEKLHFEVFISLSCHNCPDVVQSLNQFALLNDQVSSEMIDGGLFQELIEERNIQGVPSVY